MTRLALIAVGLFWVAYFLGRGHEYRSQRSQEDTYRRALIRRLLDSDVEIHMEV